MVKSAVSQEALWKDLWKTGTLSGVTGGAAVGNWQGLNSAKDG